MLNRWWQTPQLHSDEEANRERKTGWLELFFDLVFVAVIAELSHTLADDISWGGLGQFVFLFIPAWWVWIGATFDPALLLGLLVALCLVQVGYDTYTRYNSPEIAELEREENLV